MFLHPCWSWKKIQINQPEWKDKFTGNVNFILTTRVRCFNPHPCYSTIFYPMILGTNHAYGVKSFGQQCWSRINKRYKVHVLLSKITVTILYYILLAFSSLMDSIVGKGRGSRPGKAWGSSNVRLWHIPSHFSFFNWVFWSARFRDLTH